MITSDRDRFALYASLALMGTAFAGSYLHVVTAVQSWGQTGWIAYAIAAMPEVTVMIGMRRVMTRSMTPVTWIFLGSAGAFTLGGNLHAAQHTIGGVVAAGWPAWSAVGALIFAGVHASPVAEVKPVPRPVRPRIAAAPLTLARVSEPVGDPEVTTSSVRDALLAQWSPGQPLTREVRSRVMSLTSASESTIKRAAKAIAEETS